MHMGSQQGIGAILIHCPTRPSKNNLTGKSY